MTRWKMKGSVDLIPLSCDYILYYFLQDEDLQFGCFRMDHGGLVNIGLF